MMLGSAIFSTFSLIVACIVKSRERFMGVGQVLTMPLFFASNAIYPLSLMPSWLQVVSKVNPLSYQVDALRTLMIVGSSTSFGLSKDFLPHSVRCSLTEMRTVGEECFLTYRIKHRRL